MRKGGVRSEKGGGDKQGDIGFLRLLYICTSEATKSAWRQQQQQKQKMNHKKKIQIIKVKSKIKLSVCVTFFYNPIYI